MTLQESSGESGLFVTAARYLLRGAGVCSLATVEAGSGSPYASMITAATETDGTPLFLISRLALHTRNLEADNRGSILFMAGGDAADPLSLGRVSAMGRAEKTDSPLARTRFLARHPEAAGYAGFADFALWRLLVEKAHYVGGFGKIVTLAGDQVIRRGAEIAAWEAEITGSLEEINARHGTLLAKLGGDGAAWRLAACDLEGGELLSEGRALRLVFPEPLQTVYQILDSLQRLAENGATSR